MRVDIWSDVVCPWCYVGIRNLDEALADFDHAGEVEVVYRSFQLDPGAPPHDPTPLVTQLARKYGTSEDQIRASQQRLVDIGSQRGIDFDFERTMRGNTLDAHRLLHLAAESGHQDALKRRFMRAYFTEGQAIGDHDVLRALALEVGLDGAEVDEVLAGDRYELDVVADIATARKMGTSGVPFFVFDQRLAVGGAQPPEVLADVLRQAWDSREPAVVTVAAGEGDVCGPEGCQV